MKRILTVLLFGLCFAVPVIALAQDTPTPEFPTETAVVLETATPFETPTSEPTATETATVTPSPTPTPVPVPPPFIDTTQIPTWVFVLMVIVFLAALTLGGVGILVAAKLAPPWVVEMLLSAAKSGVSTLENKSKETETGIDDLAVEEIKRRLEKLEADYRAQPEKMEQIAQAVVAQNK